MFFYFVAVINFSRKWPKFVCVTLISQLSKYTGQYNTSFNTHRRIKGVVNCQNSRDKGPPESNIARG